MAKLAWTDEFIGRFIYVEGTVKDVSECPGIAADAGVVVIAPDTFGQKGSVLREVEAEAPGEKLAKALQAALAEYQAARKDVPGARPGGASARNLLGNAGPGDRPDGEGRARARPAGRSAAKGWRQTPPRRGPVARPARGVFHGHGSRPSNRPRPIGRPPGPMRVLVVEDEPELRGSWPRPCARTATPLTRPPTATDGLFKATAWAYDVVLLDLMMPGPRRLELLAARREKQTPGSDPDRPRRRPRPHPRTRRRGRRLRRSSRSISPSARPRAAPDSPGGRAGRIDDRRRRRRHRHRAKRTVSRPASRSCSRPASTPSLNCWRCTAARW